jgi:Glycosyl transferase family 8
MTRRIAAVYFCDVKFHDLTLFSLASLARSHRSGLDIHFLQSEYSRPPPAALSELTSARGHRLFVNSVSFRGPSAGTGRDTAKYKADALDGLVKDYDYLLYIDGDTLVFEDLQLHALAGFSQLLAACTDLSVTAGVDDPGFIQNCEAHALSPAYFNSGFIFINTAQWIATLAMERYRENLARHKVECPYIRGCYLRDQCAWNMTAAGMWNHLPTTMNVQKIAIHTKAWRDAKIRHYTGSKKFIPIRNRTCDRREFALLRALSRESGLQLPQPHFWDGGVMNWINSLRRYPEIARATATITRLAQ